MVVVTLQHLHDRRRAAEPSVGPDEDACSPSPDEEIDQRLRKRQVDLSDRRRRPFAPVETWVVDVDVETVLMGDMTRPEPASARPAEVSDTKTRSARVLRRVQGPDMQDEPNEIVRSPTAPGTIGLAVEQRVPGEERRTARGQLHAPGQ